MNITGVLKYRLWIEYDIELSAIFTGGKVAGTIAITGLCCSFITEKKYLISIRGLWK